VRPEPADRDLQALCDKMSAAHHALLVKYFPLVREDAEGKSCDGCLHAEQERSKRKMWNKTNTRDTLIKKKEQTKNNDGN
jgi:hypothetical protein